MTVTALQAVLSGHHSPPPRRIYRYSFPLRWKPSQP